MRSTQPATTNLRTHWFAIICTSLLAFAIGCAPSVSRNDLAAQIESGTAPLVLDVRSEEEYAEGHVPGAVNIPFQAVDDRHGELAVAKDEPIVVYCGHGPRAGWAARSLRKAGYTNVVTLEGHMTSWVEDGRATEAVPTATPVD
jgi:rhodanese-related sulfurtransferase